MIHTHLLHMCTVERSDVPRPPKGLPHRAAFFATPPARWGRRDRSPHPDADAVAAAMLATCGATGQAARCTYVQCCVKFSALCTNMFWPVTAAPSQVLFFFSLVLLLAHVWFNFHITAAGGAGAEEAVRMYDSTRVASSNTHTAANAVYFTQQDRGSQGSYNQWVIVGTAVRARELAASFHICPY